MSTTTTSHRRPPTPLNLDLTIISAKHLKNVNWKTGPLHPYAVVFLDPNHRLATKSDDSNSTKPVWNERFLIPIPSSISAVVLTLQVFHSKPSDTPKPLVGTVRVPVCDLDKYGVRSFDLIRPSGRPQGKIRLRVGVRDRMVLDYQIASNHGFNYDYAINPSYGQFPPSPSPYNTTPPPPYSTVTPPPPPPSPYNTAPQPPPSPYTTAPQPSPPPYNTATAPPPPPYNTAPPPAYNTAPQPPPPPYNTAPPPPYNSATQPPPPPPASSSPPPPPQASPSPPPPLPPYNTMPPPPYYTARPYQYGSYSGSDPYSGYHQGGGYYSHLQPSPMSQSYTERQSGYGNVTGDDIGGPSAPVEYAQMHYEQKHKAGKVAPGAGLGNEIGVGAVARGVPTSMPRSYTERQSGYGDVAGGGGVGVPSAPVEFGQYEQKHDTGKVASGAGLGLGVGAVAGLTIDERLRYQDEKVGGRVESDLNARELDDYSSYRRADY